nr:MAG TPA: hypothetical protein [Caudoviricetes sp.]
MSWIEKNWNLQCRKSVAAAKCSLERQNVWHVLSRNRLQNRSKPLLRRKIR